MHTKKLTAKTFPIILGLALLAGCASSSPETVTETVPSSEQQTESAAESAPAESEETTAEETSAAETQETEEASEPAEEAQFRGIWLAYDEYEKLGLTILEDDLADARKIRQSKNRLENLGYFSNVEILPKTTENPGRRDLTVQVEEKPTGSVSLGAAFSTEDNVMGFLELSETNFSLQKLLKLEKPKGDGQRMRAYVGLGPDTNAVNISLTEPSLFDSPFELTNEFFLNTRFEDDYDERHVGYGVTLSYPIAFQIPFIPEHTEYWRLGMGVRIEHIRISDLDREEKFNPKDEATWPERWDSSA